MIVEITGVSTENKGAELMLQAIVEHYAPARDVEFAVARDFGGGTERAAYGLWTKLYTGRLRRRRIAAALLPRFARQSLRLVSEADIAAVLDASGFAFGDQLGHKRTNRFANDVRRWKAQGKPVVLLPQALGPFETIHLQNGMRQVVASVDRIYAREPESLAHLRKLVGDVDILRLAPDFTCLVDAALPDDFAPDSYQACVVPNHRMIEKLDASERDQYIPFLTACLRELERRNLSPYLLLHDNRIDESLVNPLEQAYGHSLRVVRESDPRKLKGILGTARLVIGSRFHALVSALSQGVPSLAVGWSHKYDMLLADYGCPEYRLSPSSTQAEIRDAIGWTIDDDRRGRLVSELQRAGRTIREQVRQMWRDVDDVLGITVPEAATVPAARSAASFHASK